MGKVKSLKRSDLSLDLFVKIFLSIGILSTIYLMFNDRLILRFIPINTQSLNQIASISSVTGSVYRKIYNDTLYLPLFVKHKIFEGDLITTDAQSTATIEISKNNYIITEPNSSIRLKMEGKKLFIQLHQGSVITQFSEDTLITIKQGLENHDVQIKKGSFLIKNESGGIQIQAYDHRSKNRRMKKSKKKPNKIKEEEPEKTVESESVLPTEQEEMEAERAQMVAEMEQEKLEAQQLSVPLRLPNPADHTVFLMKSNFNLILAYRNICPSKCKLLIKKEGKTVFEQEFKEKQIPIHELPFDDSSIGHYEWTYSEDEDIFNLSFDLFPFSGEAFDKALKSGSPVEVH